MGSIVFEFLILSLLFLSSFSEPVYSIAYSSTANLSTLWTNNVSLSGSIAFPTTIPQGTILIKKTNLSVGCGFLANDNVEFYFSVFAITAINPNISLMIGGNTQVLWSANRNRPVKENSTLELTSSGDLVLKDVDGSFVWSTNTSGKSVVGMKINGTGNLILHDENNKIIWQSFDHPTDTWVTGQKLSKGQRLVAATSDSNTSTSPIYVELSNDGLYAYIDSQLYATYAYNTSAPLHINVVGETYQPEFVFTLVNDRDLEYIRLYSDGHIRRSTFFNGGKAVLSINILTKGTCDYPTVCGRYGICSDEECTCPGYFEQIDFTKPSHGCVRTTQLSMDNPQLHMLLELGQVDYFNFIEDLTKVSIESCKNACLQNHSCEAAVFRYSEDLSFGDCSLQREVFSLVANKQIQFYNSTTFLKVQEPSVKVEGPSIVPRPHGHLRRILVAIFSSISILILIIVFGLVFSSVRKKVLRKSEENNQHERGWDSFDQMSGMPKRFSFADLKSATSNFSIRLGGGGFGSVFEGHLNDGEKIAVKRLDDLGQGRKEFIAEVKTIGSIHHFNLVRLIGFCAENSHKLLVYAYMSNGSLEKWIFQQNQELTLDWKTKKSIIIDIAKGLSYLHEDCQQRIVHLDIKPQNILLDGNFNAKISDFGLARFIDRDQSQVLTAMRGTRGYLAPEWLLNRRISQKVDVYSFGVVVLEILSGRKNLDYSRREERDCLLDIVRRKAEEDQLFDIVEKQSEHMPYKEEAIKMIRIAIWCLQSDPEKRPSMSLVVKVLEDAMEVEKFSNFSFLTLIPVDYPVAVNASGSEPPSPTILSGPR